MNIKSNAIRILPRRESRVWSRRWSISNDKCGHFLRIIPIWLILLSIIQCNNDCQFSVIWCLVGDCFHILQNVLLHNPTSQWTSFRSISLSSCLPSVPNITLVGFLQEFLSMFSFRFMMFQLRQAAARPMYGRGLEDWAKVWSWIPDPVEDPF